MACKKENTAAASAGDCIELDEGRQRIGGSGAQWLVGQAIAALNRADAADERDYNHIVALLREHAPAGDALLQLAHDSATDPTLRWNVLHVLGDAGDLGAADFLVKAALERLPERRKEGCEGPFDTELLNRTMAVHAIAAIAGRDAKAAEGLLRVIEAGPERAVLVEAVKAAVELGHRERVQGLLAKEDQWILDIKRASHRDVHADPERADGKEIGFAPPRRGAQHTAPQACGCNAGGQ